MTRIWQAIPRSAVAWCEQALGYRDDPSFAVDVQRVAGGALTSMGEPRRALELMTAAAATARPNDPVRAAEILAEAIAPALMQGRGPPSTRPRRTGRVYLGTIAGGCDSRDPHCLGHGGRGLLFLRRHRPGRPLPAPRRRLPIVLQHDGGAARCGVPRPKSRLGRAVLRGPPPADDSCCTPPDASAHQRSWPSPSPSPLKSAGGAASGRRPMPMRPRRCSGRLRTASLACSATASACWRALKQHGVSVKRARLGSTRCDGKSSLEALAACPCTATRRSDWPH